MPAHSWAAALTVKLDDATAARLGRRMDGRDRVSIAGRGPVLRLHCQACGQDWPGAGACRRLDYGRGLPPRRGWPPVAKVSG